MSSKTVLKMHKSVLQVSTHLSLPYWDISKPHLMQFSNITI